MKRHGSMNHIYRLIWSHVLNAWVAVAEKSRGRGKSASRKLASVALAISAAGAALAAPAGGQLASGVGSIATSGATTTITQSSQNLALNWKSFNIGAQETVNFVQPTAGAIAVNRIFDTNGSQILGHLNANGQVYLINPNGILFGQGAQVNVGGMVASTLDLNDASLSGNARTFAGNGKGAIVNLGAIHAIDGGYVALLGNHVSNQGNISARLGSVALGAGSAATLNFSGNSLVSMQVDQSILSNLADNGGLINADGGQVVMSAGARDALLASVVNNSGVIEARTVEHRAGSIILQGGAAAGQVHVSGTLDASSHNGGGVGGTVKVLGDQITLLAGANIDVSGTQGGGSALVGGNFHGAGLESNASDVGVAQGAVINADAIVEGNGGKVAIWADQHLDFAGAISAKGGARSGDGGFVETSGKQTLNFTGAVDTTASHGKTGTLLLDPTDIAISSDPSSSGMSNNSGVFTDMNSPSSTLNVNVLQAALGSNNVTIDTASSQGGFGDISVQNAINWSNGNALTLNANRNINVFSAISNTGIGALNLQAGGDITMQSTVNLKGAVSLNSAGVVTTGIINAGTIAVKAAANVNINGALVSTDTGNFAIVVNAGANAAAGNGGGGNILILNSVPITVGAGGRATLYSGTVSGSSGLTNLVGSGSGRFRYFSDEASTNYTTPLSSGLYAIYRESPTLNVAATAVNATYGDVIAAPTATATGGQNGDTPVFSYDGARSASGHLAAGSHAIANGLGYTLNFASGFRGDLTVSQKALTVTAAGASKVYDGSATAGVTLNDNRLGSDVLTLSNAAATFLDKNVANGKTINVSGISIGGADAGNYTFNTAATSTANITAKALTVGGVTAGNKVYDGNTSATLNTGAVTLAGLVAGDTVTLNASGLFDDKHVATGKNVALTSRYSGADVGNYIIANQAEATAAITAKALTITGMTAANKVYDSTTSATLSGGVLSGLVGTETLSFSGQSGVFSGKDAGSGKSVTVTGATLGTGSGLASNYSLSNPTGLSAAIDQATVTATASTNQVKVFGAVADPVLAYSVTGLIGSDVADNVLSGNLVREAGEIAGRRAITQGSLASSDTNYTLAFTAGSLLIVPRVQVPVSAPGVTVTAPNPAVISLAALNADEEGRKRRAIPVAEDSIPALAQITIVDGGVRMPAAWSAR